MNIDKKRLYMLSSALAPVFLLVCFIRDAVTRRFVLIAVVGAALIAVSYYVKKRSPLSINKKQLLWVLPTFAFLGIMLLYMLGLKFGFYRVAVNSTTFLYKILPLAIIITVSEIIREKLLMQDNRIVSIISFVAFIICDIAMLCEVRPFSNFRIFVSFMGNIVFPCIAAAILYYYISKRYGALPVILYRLLTTLYASLIPISPNVPNALLSFAKIFFPIAAVFFVSLLYEKRKNSFSRKKISIQAAVTAFTVLLMAGIMMLISCQFRYGLLVVASPSMTGSIDKGDAIIYEEYNSEVIKEGQVVVFNKNDRVYIHRVIKIEKIDGIVRYITKGDANDEADTGFITDENIIGLTDVTIKYIGHPTLWMRALFK